MHTSEAEKPCTIVGAGLAGSLLAIYMARRGHKVRVYERRGDLREHDGSAGKSINLALSTRGLKALEGVGLADEIRKLAIPMEGRMIHDKAGKMSFQPYGLKGQAILSVERRALNERLMDMAEKEAGVEFRFHERCVDLNWKEGVAVLRNEKTGEMTEEASKVIFGADGAFSGVRQRMQRTNRFYFEQKFLEHGYKELSMPPAPDGNFALPHNALHIWPREDFMLIALPNPDRTFTCTLFLSFEGKKSFEALEGRNQVATFFEQEFPDVIPLIPDYLEQFEENPTGTLVMVRCDPYHKGERVGILGDAAHAIVPFYGQGMNAAFEDCTLLERLMERHGSDWPRVLKSFSATRVKDADAIGQLALHNYVEMRSDVANPWFVWRKKLERLLHRWLPETFIPLYSMVTFSNIPYAKVIERSKKQDAWLNLALLLAGGLILGAVLILVWVLLSFLGG